MSLTDKVYGKPSRPGYIWIYYIIKEHRELEAAIQNRWKHPVVLMFWADWNPPCQVMLKPFRDMALAKNQEAVFCRVDTDKFKDFVARYKVEALPTFVLIKNDGTECGRVVGVKVEELNKIIKNNI